MIELVNVSKTYKSKKGTNTRALNNISTKFENVGMTFVLGKSGCGKSTLLNIIGGLDKFDTGNVFVDSKDLKKFSNREYDKYRNSYIGFVFQEYNLLDELNVYQNIALSLKLQNDNTNNIDTILKKVGIEDLKFRKINELSGGQKQRVAIARALVKNPKVLLCDEPTGNLDSESSKQIFELLKQISKERLVIVVSHDEESARNYADRIIGMQDGQIISDTGINNNSLDIDSLNLKTPKLPISFKLSLAFNNFFSKKIRLIISMVLLIASLIGFGVMNSLSKIDRNEKFIEEYNYRQKDNDIMTNNTIIRKYGVFYSVEDYENGKTNIAPYRIPPISMTSDIKSKAEMLTGQDWSYEYNLIQDGKYLTIEFPYNKIPTNLYFELTTFTPSFVEISNTDINIGTQIIGNVPSEYDEIIVSNYFADSIINGGIELLNGEIYKPSSYEQIINEQKEIKFYNFGLKIVGIANYDMSKFNILKQFSYGDYNNDTIYSLHYDFDTIVDNLLTRMYVKEGFINNLNLKDNNILKAEGFKYIYGENIDAYDTIGYITNDMVIYDGNLSSNYKLNINDVVINLEMLNKLTSGNFQLEYNKFIYSSSEITDEDKINFITSYIDKSNILGTSIFTNLSNNMMVYAREDYINYKIVGVNLDLNSDGFAIYFNDNHVNAAISDSKSPTQIYSIINSSDALKKLINEIPIDSGYEITSNSFSTQIVDSYITSNKITKILGIIVIIISIIQILVLTNFVFGSINNKKKQIGILKALGTSDKDIFGIFLLQSFIIVVISVVFSIIGINIINEWFNNTLKDGLSISFKLFNFNTLELLKLISFSLITTIITCLFSLKKITSVKPIDVILDK